MVTRTVVETPRDRKALVADAGFSKFSFASAWAGVMSACGALAVLAGAAVAIVKAADGSADLTTRWYQLSLGEGLVGAGLVLVAFLFGGYVAGRMARRAGVLHGVTVFVMGAVIAGVAALLVHHFGTATRPDNHDVALLAGLVAAAAALAGSVVGGRAGERWHAKLLTRALDPQVGAEAEARRDAERRSAEAERLRTASYERVRTATPSRTRRVDREAVTQATPAVAASGSSSNAAPAVRGPIWAASRS